MNASHTSPRNPQEARLSQHPTLHTTGPTARRLVALMLLALGALTLAACGSGDGDDEPVPTLFSLDDHATADADRTATAVAGLPTPTVPTATPTVTNTASPSATVTPLPTSPPAPTVTASPSATASATEAASATPDEPPPEQVAATGIPLTNTALAAAGTLTATAETAQAATQTAEGGMVPITQTVAAVRAATGTTAAVQGAVVTLTPTPEAPDFTPQPSEDAYTIVFYSDRNGTDDIFLLALNGETRALVSGAANEREPVCLPDGAGVVYASNASGSFQLYLLRFDGSAPVQLTDSAGQNFAPALSPDGTQLAFVSTRNEGVPAIWLMGLDGSNPRQVTTSLGRDTTPAWGPDGRQIVFSSEQFGPWDLYLTLVRETVEGEFPLLPPDFSGDNQLWPSFDGRGERIAYTVWEDLNDPQTADIFLLDFEQPEPVPVRAGEGADIAWSWGDDTRLLASVGGPDDVQIALVDVATGEVTRLTDAGSFNGGARLCPVERDALPPEPTPPPSPTPTLTPTLTPTPSITPSPPPSATPSPTPSPTPRVLSPALAAAQGYRHIVQPGESLQTIGNQFGVNWVDLVTINELTDPDQLSIGQPLIIPVTRPGPVRVGGPQHPDETPLVPMAPHKAIVVSIKSQQLFAYENGRVVRTMSVSTGAPQFPTVEGEFEIYWKLPSQTMRGPGYSVPNVPWVMYFHGDYSLHGVYWHNNFGTPVSHGCVNLPTPEARWLYEWSDVGTPVTVMP